jgi:hypothetical protein
MGLVSNQRGGSFVGPGIAMLPSTLGSEGQIRGRPEVSEPGFSEECMLKPGTDWGASCTHKSVISAVWFMSWCEAGVQSEAGYQKWGWHDCNETERPNKGAFQKGGGSCRPWNLHLLLAVGGHQHKELSRTVDWSDSRDIQINSLGCCLQNGLNTQTIPNQNKPLRSWSYYSGGHELDSEKYSNRIVDDWFNIHREWRERFLALGFQTLTFCRWDEASQSLLGLRIFGCSREELGEDSQI